MQNVWNQHLLMFPAVNLCVWLDICTSALSPSESIVSLHVQSFCFAQTLFFTVGDEGRRRGGGLKGRCHIISPYFPFHIQLIFFVPRREQNEPNEKDMVMMIMMTMTIIHSLWCSCWWGCNIFSSYPRFFAGYFVGRPDQTRPEGMANNVLLLIFTSHAIVTLREETDIIPFPPVSLDWFPLSLFPHHSLVSQAPISLFLFSSWNSGNERIFMLRIWNHNESERGMRRLCSHKICVSASWLLFWCSRRFAGRQLSDTFLSLFLIHWSHRHDVSFLSRKERLHQFFWNRNHHSETKK